MSRMLLIDGSGLLVANYYGTLPQSAYEEPGYKDIQQLNGYYVNAVFPTIKQIFDIAISANATSLAVAFDRSRNTFRRELNPDYKANRKETPFPLKQQFKICADILNKLGIFTISDEHYEADDLVGSISKQYCYYFDDTVILTKDKDYIQLVDSFTTVWMMLYKKEAADLKLKQFGLTPEDGYNEYLPAKVFPYTPATVLKDKGIDAENFNHVLALVGDKADNIKGVRGVSEEVGLKLIAEYKTIDELYEEIVHANYNKSAKELKEYWKTNLGIKRSPFNALNDYEKDARESLVLATIKTDIDLKDFNIFDLELSSKFLDYKDVKLSKGFVAFRDNLYKEVTDLINELPKGDL